MALYKHFALTVAALALMPIAQALAADYDPPITVEQADEYAPVEVGSGWYLRGDIAYSSNVESTDVDFGLTPVSYSEDETPVFGSIGFGYHFTDYLRADVNFGYAPGLEQGITYNTPLIAADASTKNYAWTGILNGYVDLGTFVGFTPYVGAGAGFMQSTYKVNGNYTDATQSVSSYADESKFSFAYTLNAGVAYQIAPNLKLDVGYQYLSAPDAETVAIQDFTTFPVQSGIDYHQVKVGLRYDLW